MHIDKWRVSFSLLRKTVEIFVTFGEVENYLQTVKESEEVAVWHSAGTDIIHHLVLDTRVNVIGLKEDLKFQRFLLWFCFAFKEIIENRIYCSINLEKYKVNGVKESLNTFLNDSSKKWILFIRSIAQSSVIFQGLDQNAKNKNT